MDTNTEHNAPTTALPAFRTIRQVWGLKIRDVNVTSIAAMISSGLLMLDDAGYAPIPVTAAWMERNKPTAGGYYVQTEDGHTFFLPAHIFERDNVPVNHWGLRRSQEPKYDVNERGRLINRKSGVPIPDEEPVVVLRAKDPLTEQAIKAYMHAAEAHGLTDVASGMATQLQAGHAYRESYPERVKLPD